MPDLNFANWSSLCQLKPDLPWNWREVFRTSSPLFFNKQGRGLICYLLLNVSKVRPTLAEQVAAGGSTHSFRVGRVSDFTSNGESELVIGNPEGGHVRLYETFTIRLFQLPETPRIVLFRAQTVAQSSGLISPSTDSVKWASKYIPYVSVLLIRLCTFATIYVFNFVVNIDHTQRKKKESLVTKPSLPKESVIIPEESMHFIRRSSLIFW